MKRFLFGLMCLSATAYGTCDWPSVNHDYNNTRSNPCEKILSRENVQNLVEVGAIPSAYQVQVCPIIVGNVIYFGDTGGFVRAYDATTLTQIWEFNTGASIDAPVTFHDGIIYAANVAINLYALDAATGELQAGWPVVVDPNNVVGADILAAPVVVDGIVIVPTCDGVPPAFGTDANPSRHQSISAFTTTGALIWRRVIQPLPLGAQGGSFSTAAIDRKLHLMFIGTSNADDHPVGNQTDALLALDYRTGEEVWSRQYTKNDAWGALYPIDPDADIGASPNLFHVRRHGKKIPVVGVASKKGDYRVWERKTGKPVWKTKTVPHGWHYISFSGPGAAYDKSTGLIYVPTEIDNTANNFQLLTILGANGNTDAQFIEFVVIAFGQLGASPPLQPTGNTCITALDANTGKKVWQFKAPTIGSGSVTAANGVVYFGNWNGQIFALDGKSGKVLLFDNTTFPPFPNAILGGAFSIKDGRLYVPVGIGGIPIPGGIHIFGL